MTNRTMLFVCSAVAGLSMLAGCGDPLTDKWKNSDVPPGGTITAQTIELRFSSGKLNTSIKQTYSATSPTYAGCASTVEIDGYDYTQSNITTSGSTTSGTLTISGTPAITATRTGCATASDNGSATQPTATGFTLTGTSMYSITGNTLTIGDTGTAGTTYTRE